MLPSCGFFKAFRCIYHDEERNCARPYCHFMHNRVRSNETQYEKDTSTIDEAAKLVACHSNRAALDVRFQNQIYDEIIKEKYSLHEREVTTAVVTPTIKVTSSGLTQPFNYVATPLQKVVYNPTPKHQLETHDSVAINRVPMSMVAAVASLQRRPSVYVSRVSAQRKELPKPVSNNIPALSTYGADKPAAINFQVVFNGNERMATSSPETEKILDDEGLIARIDEILNDCAEVDVPQKQIDREIDQLIKVNEDDKSLLWMVFGAESEQRAVLNSVLSKKKEQKIPDVSVDVPESILKNLNQLQGEGEDTSMSQDVVIKEEPMDIVDLTCSPFPAKEVNIHHKRPYDDKNRKRKDRIRSRSSHKKPSRRSKSPSSNSKSERTEKRRDTNSLRSSDNRRSKSREKKNQNSVKTGKSEKQTHSKDYSNQRSTQTSKYHSSSRSRHSSSSKMSSKNRDKSCEKRSKSISNDLASSKFHDQPTNQSRPKCNKPHKLLDTENSNNSIHEQSPLMSFNYDDEGSDLEIECLKIFQETLATVPSKINPYLNSNKLPSDDDFCEPMLTKKRISKAPSTSNHSKSLPAIKRKMDIHAIKENRYASMVRDYSAMTKKLEEVMKEKKMLEMIQKQRDKRTRVLPGVKELKEQRGKFFEQSGAQLDDETGETVLNQTLSSHLIGSVDQATPQIHNDATNRRANDLSTLPGLLEQCKRRKRIAHVPNVSKLIEAKQDVPSHVHFSTISKTIPKGAQRTAHVPNPITVLQKNLIKIADPNNSKFPLTIRTEILNDMVNVLMDRVSFDCALEKARIEELAIFKRCNSLNIYKKSAKLAVHRLKNKSLDDKPTSNMFNTKFLDQFYTWCVKHSLTPKELTENGFPRPGAKGATFTDILKKEEEMPTENTRRCSRCHKLFKIDDTGEIINTQSCVYHPKRLIQRRGEGEYPCCSSTPSIPGCSTADSHVWDFIQHKNLKGFVKTISKPESDDHRIYALDCEMCYTTAGSALTRVTVVDHNLKTVYDTFVKPLNRIVDYNTQFSGITAEHLKNETTTLHDVQASLLYMFDDRTVLIGHSLDSDLRALRLIHDLVVDTSVLYPHRRGSPFKRSLKNLASEFLQRIIQNQISGHDSSEDALAAMELAIAMFKRHTK